MAQRVTFVSAGSNTRIKSGPGTLYALAVSPVAGGSVVLADAPDLGALPNLNSKSLTSTFAYFGPAPASPTPYSLDFRGLPFSNGLVIAATSSASVSVIWD